MPEALEKGGASAEAALHQAVRELAERAWREQGIRLDHVFISWDQTERIEGPLVLSIKSVSITAHSFPR